MTHSQNAALKVWRKTRFLTQLKILKILLEMTPHPFVENTLRTQVGDWVRLGPNYKNRYMLKLMNEVHYGGGRNPTAWTLKLSMEDLHDALNIPKEKTTP